MEKDLRRFLARSFFVKEDEIGREDSFLDVGIIDSTGVMELVEFLEKRFEIELDDDEIIPENLDSIERIIKFVEGKAI